MAAAPRTTSQTPREAGFMLVEMLVAVTTLLLVTAATMAILVTAGHTQSRDSAYADEVASTQTALSRLVHDLRAATRFLYIAPNKIEFQAVLGSTTWNVLYDCTAADTLGSAYTRCARTQAIAPALPAAASATPGSADIQHVANGTITTFCNGAGSAASGSVFFVANSAIPNTDGSNLACDEAHETEIGPGLLEPTYVQVLVSVGASGDLKKGGMTHQTVLQAGTFLPNSDPGATNG